MELAVGDQVTVTGSRVSSGDSPIVLVRRLIRGTEVLDFRNDAARPLWAVPIIEKEGMPAVTL